MTVYAADGNSHTAEIDWVKGVIISGGISSLGADDSGSAIDKETGEKISLSSSRDRAYEKAKETAIFNAANAISEILVSPDTRIRDLIINDRSIRQSISHYLHENSKFKEKPAGYLTAGCELELKLGYLINALKISFPENEFPLRDDVEISTKYTSLIVDARGLKLKPMLMPSILNENGLEVYSRNYISGQVAVKHLAVSYAFSEKEAMKHKKAGSRPFYCNALKTLNGNPVLSDEDIKRVFSHKEQYKQIHRLSKSSIHPDYKKRILFCCIYILHYRNNNWYKYGEELSQD